LFKILFDVLFRSVVDKDVDPTEFLHSEADSVTAQLLLADVSVDEQALPSLFLDHLASLFGVPLLIEV
jgi:hypothetical protein